MPAKQLKASAKGEKKLKIKTTDKKIKATSLVVSKTSRTTRVSGLSVPLYKVDGKKNGNVELPKEIFGVAVSEKLMAQAARVYLVNQRQGTASTKTRGEVRGSTRKIYRQKGTGRARHGGIRAPIFVGGGIALGPRPRKFELKLSKQMRKKALFSSLSFKLSEEKVSAVDAAALTGATSQVYDLFKTLKFTNKKGADKVLFIADNQEAIRASSNIKGVRIIPAHSINTYEVLNSNYLILAKDSIQKMKEVFIGGKV